MMMEKAHHTVSAQRYKDVGIKFYHKIFFSAPVSSSLLE